MREIIQICSWCETQRIAAGERPAVLNTLIFDLPGGIRFHVVDRKLVAVTRKLWGDETGMRISHGICRACRAKEGVRVQ